MEKIINVVIPCYNSHKTLSKTLDSISIQTLNLKEMIKVTIIDDHSENSYDAIISRHRDLDIEVITLTERLTIGEVRQIGIDNCKYKYLTFIDSDDIFFDCLSLERLYKPFEENKFICVVQGSILEYNFYKKKKETQLHEASHGIWLHGTMFKTDMLRHYDISFPKSSHGEDTEFIQQLNLLFMDKGKFFYIKDIVYLWTDLNKKERITDKEFENITSYIKWLESHVNAIKKTINKVPFFEDKTYKQYVFGKYLASYFNFLILWSNSKQDETYCLEYFKYAKYLYDLAIEFNPNFLDKGLWWLYNDKELCNFVERNGTDLDFIKSEEKELNFFSYSEMIKQQKILVN